MHIACLIPELFGLLKKICVDAWSEQLDVIQRKKKALALDNWVKLTLSETATAATAMILDREPTIEPTVIKSLIQKGISDATRGLTTSIARLELANARSSEKRPGGQPAPRQQTKRNKSKKKKKSKGPAAASDNDTSSDKRKKKQTSTRKSNSKKKNQPSRNSEPRRTE